MPIAVQQASSWRALRASIRGWRARSAAQAEIDGWRRKDAFDALNPLSNGFLRQSDEQSLLALRALLDLAAERGWDLQDHRDWGIVSAARFPGRIVMASSVEKYAKEGPRTTSPHVIPHRSLHGISGTISMALACGGPNVGVGGGPHPMAQGLVTALLMLREQRLPGVWLTLSEWEPEPMPKAAKGNETCRALVAALVPKNADPDEPELMMLPGEARAPAKSASLIRLIDYLSPAEPVKTPWACELEWGARLEINRRAQADKEREAA